MMPTGPTEPTGNLTSNMTADIPAVARSIDQAVERALVLSDMDLLIGQAIDAWLYCPNPATTGLGASGTEVMPRPA